jgi:hypothetical protein
MMTNDNLGLSDERLTRTNAKTIRASRDNADANRTTKDGSALSSAERKATLRQEWVQSILPQAPEIPGYHCCWLSTTNSADPIYQRVRMGYTPVKVGEVPGFGTAYEATEGEFEGCVSCKEMLLFKIPSDVYQSLMEIYHHDIPNEQEGAIYENANASLEEDSNGKSLGIVEGDFNRLGTKVPAPLFT